MSALAHQQISARLFLVAFPLALHHFRYALVVLSDALHDRFGLRVLKVLGDAENFLRPETPILWVFKISGHAVLSFLPYLARSNSANLLHSMFGFMCGQRV
jgi:hypothetical protein